MRRALKRRFFSASKRIKRASMIIRNILVYVDGSSSSSVAIKGAIKIAKDFDAKLTGFYLIPNFNIAAAMPDGAMVSEAVVAGMREDADKKAAAAKKLFGEETKSLSLKTDWACIDASRPGPQSKPASMSFYSDLTVISQYDDEAAEADATLPQDLVVDSGRPVMLIPKTATTTDFGKHIMIAWKEGSEAARAMSDALPFLSRAETVSVVTVAKQDATEDAVAVLEKVKQLLLDHGIKAIKVALTPKDGESTSTAIFEHAEQSGADMLVAGAFSRARWKENLFGGVTKSIFESVPVPTLISH